MPSERDLGRLYERYYTHGSAGRTGGLIGKSAGRLRHIEAAVWPTPRAAKRARDARQRLLPDDLPLGSVLEVGCGDGENLLSLRARGWVVAGQEIDPAAVAVASQRLGIDVMTGPLHECGLAPSSFDAVLLHHVVEHLADAGGVLRECARLVRPNGVLAIYTPNAAAFGHRRFGRHWRGLEPPRHLCVYGPRSIAALVESVGFRVVSVTTQSHLASFMAIESTASALHRVPRAFRAVPARTVALVFHLMAGPMRRWRPESGEELVVIARRS